jgi:hypothetical protein
MTQHIAKGRPKGSPKTGGREKGSAGLRVLLTLPKATVERIASNTQTSPTEKELRVFLLKAVDEFLEGQDRI